MIFDSICEREPIADLAAESQNAQNLKEKLLARGVQHLIAHQPLSLINPKLLDIYPKMKIGEREYRHHHRFIKE